MNPDVAIVTGLFLCGLAIVSAISAYSEGHRPRVAVLVMVAGCGLVYYAATNRPEGYSIKEIPDAIFRVVGMIL